MNTPVLVNPRAENFIAKFSSENIDFMCAA